MPDLNALAIHVRVTVLEAAVLIEVAPDSRNGVSCIIPLDDLPGEGDEWKRGESA
jgi:hypothetical protein